MQSQGTKQAELFTTSFLKKSLPSSKDRLDEQLLRKAVVLEYSKLKRAKVKRRKAKGLNARERRELKVFQIKPEHQKLVTYQHTNSYSQLCPVVYIPLAILRCVVLTF